MFSWKFKKKDALDKRAYELGISTAELLDAYATIGRVIDLHRKSDSLIIIKTKGMEDMEIPVSEILAPKST